MKLALCLMFAAIGYSQTCTRDELKAAATAYFQAIEQRDPRPLRPVPITENGKPVKPGEGFVQTGGKLRFSRQLIDTERCGILTWGVIDETIDGATAPIMIAARVLLEAGKISAIDTILHRKEERYFNPQALIDSASQMPSPEPASREAMLAAPMADSCQCREGGVRTACASHIETLPTLADAETGSFALVNDSSVAVMTVRGGRIEAIHTFNGSR